MIFATVNQDGLVDDRLDWGFVHKKMDG